MPDDQLTEIRQRFDAIIPGPWRWCGNTETDQLYLGTMDRGRLYVLTIGTRHEEYVFNATTVEGCLRSEVSNTRVKEWCGGHDEFGGDDADGCICQDIADFLAGVMTPEEGPRYFSHDRRPYLSLHRGVQIHADLRFPVPYGADDPERRKQHGGVMRSYRQCKPKYEVLGYRSVNEWEVDQGGHANARDALYRQDFAGFEHPEATFIEHAPEDIGWLLERVSELEGQLQWLRNKGVYECPECGAEVDIAEADAL